ncbi:hypothetical protein LTR62_001036 [Meristemomyces frigidus]|uniref:S-adenosyl-L-methionine-dependent methyltransferase n=1 Tax=Meristemomyces frigidus TaxID=1508187 RepID=A0AAN7YMK9_9PEZI|nr:hypothetical protein LTR62_001036 [Meristemomyces frigidus]
MLGPFDLLIPPALLLGSLLTLPFTLASLALKGEISRLSSWPQLRHLWFQHLWFWFGPNTKILFAPRVRPLLAQAKGVVLDIGPASGIWMSELSEAVKQGKVSKIYGVEPNRLFHPQLLASAKRYGMADVYEPLDVYAQDLERCGVQKGSIDTIITVHVLCSVGAETTELVKQLHEYLKPGGQWLVYEHVASEHLPVRMWQYLLNLIWPTLLDGCHICRDTMQTLRQAVEWEKIELVRDIKEGYFESLPHVYGRLVKAA